MGLEWRYRGRAATAVLDQALLYLILVDVWKYLLLRYLSSARAFAQVIGETVVCVSQSSGRCAAVSPQYGPIANSLRLLD